MTRCDDDNVPPKEKTNNYDLVISQIILPIWLPNANLIGGNKQATNSAGMNHFKITIPFRSLNPKCAFCSHTD